MFMQQGFSIHAWIAHGFTNDYAKHLAELLFNPSPDRRIVIMPAFGGCLHHRFTHRVTIRIDFFQRINTGRHAGSFALITDVDFFAGNELNQFHCSMFLLWVTADMFPKKKPSTASPGSVAYGGYTHILTNDGCAVFTNECVCSMNV